MHPDPWIKSVLETIDSHRRLVDGALSQLSDDELVRRPAKDVNSVANILRHLGGNLLSRWTDFLTTDGEKPTRNRDQEFEEWSGDRASLMAFFDSGWQTWRTSVESLTTVDLAKTVAIRGEPHSVPLAIERSLTHTAYHVGLKGLCSKLCATPPPGRATQDQQANRLRFSLSFLCKAYMKTKTIVRSSSNTKTSTPAIARMFRFSLAELLAIITLLAIGFAWPLMLVFVVPLLCTGIAKRAGYGTYGPVVAAIALSMPLGVMCSFYYWHYPFAQPETLAELRKINSVEQLCGVDGLGSTGWAGPSRAIGSLPPAGTTYWDRAKELDAVDRLIAEFSRRNVPIRSTKSISSELLQSIWNAADRAGLLIGGEPGYSDTKSLSGYIGISHRSNGDRFAFATLMGGEQSNDHYPYYELVIPLDREPLEIGSSQWFYVDIAGIEGVNWIAFSVIAFLIMLPSTICLQLIWGIWQHRMTCPSDRRNSAAR